MVNDLLSEQLKTQKSKSLKIKTKRQGLIKNMWCFLLILCI